MKELTRIIETNFNLFFLVPILWVFLWIGASIVYRRSRGKEIFPSKPKNFLFYEGWASGHSNRSILTKLGGAQNCLAVAVLPNILVIQPRFPFNLMFLPEIYDLEYEIPRVNILSVKVKRPIFGKSVEIEFRGSDGNIRSVSLYLRKMDKFLAAIGEGSHILDSTETPSNNSIQRMR